MSDEQRYDRQLRLWAADGQQNLEDSHICLINATSTGCEILKNLVLPNIGQYTIIDDNTVKESDLSSNFFLSEDQLGASRAEAASILLNELNPSVKGNHINKSLATLLDSEGKDFWKKFNLVIITSTYQLAGPVDKLIDLLWDQNVPVLTAEAVGFYASLKIIFKERTIIQSHLNEIPDLRIDCPWVELVDYVNKLNIETLSVEEIKDIPYSVLLIYFRTKYIEQFKESPTRKPFKEFIETNTAVSSIRYADLENIEELLKFYWRGTTKTSIPLEVQRIIHDAELNNEITNETSPFWILVRALKVFVEENNGNLPLSGKVVDMASSSKAYIELQNIYRAKAKADKEKIWEHTKRIVKDANYPESNISESLVDNFCKNSQYLIVQKGSKKIFSDDLKNKVANQNSLASIYLSLLTVAKFYKENKRFPATYELARLLDLAKTHLGQEINLDNDSQFTKTIKEVIRSEGVEMINIASFIGGLGGQEALKILTNQYIPLNNTLAFDGIFSHLERWRV